MPDILKRDIIIETCCGSADDVIESEKGGIVRCELNSALYLGGLTPSLGELYTAKSKTENIKIMTMVRPRSGGFEYTDSDFEVMLHDARELINAGSDGIVFGFLKSDGNIDIERCKRMLDIAGDKESVFHRAIDVVPNPLKAIDELVSIGVTRILTSGQKKSAYEGIETIHQMEQYSDGRIEILPGAGIRMNNVCEIIDRTGVNQVHMSHRKKCMDMSVKFNPEIKFGSPDSPDEYSYDMIDSEKMKEASELLKEKYRN